MPAAGVLDTSKAKAGVTPLSCYFRIAMICSSVNRDLFIPSVSSFGTGSTANWRRKRVSGHRKNRGFRRCLDYLRVRPVGTLNLISASSFIVSLRS